MLSDAPQCPPGPVPVSRSGVSEQLAVDSVGDSGRAKRNITTGQAKAMLASVRPRDLARKPG